ncbi:MAG: hypothetical protein HKN76_16050 [Saprospiraceae bacterium]|nr:hypothetical protein [Saprospiraceae bacterium]
MPFKQLGGKVTKELISIYEESSNWVDGKFVNLEVTQTSMSFLKMAEIIYRQLSDRSNRSPTGPLPVASFNRDAFLERSEDARFIWYGHSVVLIRLLGKTILIDPMFGPDASPFGPIQTNRFSNDTLRLIDDLPEIDLVLLTHDHYDHLDLASINELKGKVKKFFVAMGVRRHLLAWGIHPDLIVEFDWWKQQDFHGINITFTPTRHFSGRGLTDRAKSLWGGWVIKTSDQSVWFSGDGGYGNHFKEIGQRLGPFDFGFMECGQYNDHWRPIHLFPDESVQAAIDAGVKLAMPVHWAAFSLSFQHTWFEPAEDFVSTALSRNLPFSVPLLGEVTSIRHPAKDRWWSNGPH